MGSSNKIELSTEQLQTALTTFCLVVAAGILVVLTFRASWQRFKIWLLGGTASNEIRQSQDYDEADNNNDDNFYEDDADADDEPPPTKRQSTAGRTARIRKFQRQ